MTFERYNTLARTLMLGVVMCALLALVFQACSVLMSTKVDAHAVSVQTVDLLQAAQGVIPKQPLDLAKFYAIADAAVALLKEGNKTLNLVNDPCSAIHPCGLLADAARTLNTARMTMGQIEIAANHEDKNLGTLDQQEATIYAGANDDVQALHALLASPDLLQTVHNLDTTSAAVADSAKQADGTLTDVHDEVHKLTHPTKKKLTFWGAMLGIGQTIQKLSPPLF
jgi:hypothetical protein